MQGVFAFHNSFDTQYRKPFGAVVCGTTVKLSLFVRGVDNVRLRLWIYEREVVLTGVATPATHDGYDGVLYSFEADMPDYPCLVWYYFLLDTPRGSLYYSAPNGIGKFADYPPHAYRITVYSANFKTPDWFKHTIVYQIFPDRFRRGREPGGLAYISSHTNKGRRVYIHENWNEDVLYKPLPGEKHYSPCDFYGGDLDGITESIPYLKSLNIGCIYLNPIFESPSNHRYDTADYMHVDPVLGGDDAAVRLSSACNQYGIRIMLDGVFSHTGADSIYFNRDGRYDSLGAYNSTKSEYFKWYDFKSYPEKYRCWWGFENLPEVCEDVPEYRRFICDMLAHWAKMGFSSWRLDVADELPDDFIRMIREEIKQNDPESILIGEVWEDASDKHSMGHRRGYVDGDELDGVMNYPFREALIKFLLNHIDAHMLCESFTAQRENYPEPFYNCALNLLSSHDTVRILNVLGEAPGRDELSREAQAAFKLSPEALMLAKKRLILAATIQFVMPGTPCIYYGDETGMMGMADPFARRPMNWQNMDYELVSAYRKLTSLRANITALSHGFAAFCAPESDVFCVMRCRDGVYVITLINKSDRLVDVSLTQNDFKCGPDAQYMHLPEKCRDMLNGNIYMKVNGIMNITLDPFGRALLINTDALCGHMENI